MANFLDENETPQLGQKFIDAIVFACQVHSRQIRKGPTKTPYIAHLLAVCAMTLESGADEDTAIAALLHDAIEDVDVLPDQIEHMFGSNVKDIVLELTEDRSKGISKAKRKATYARSVRSMSDSAVLVSLADKTHNIEGYSNNPELFDKGVYRFYRILENEYRDRIQSSPFNLQRLRDKLNYFFLKAWENAQIK